VNETVNLKRYLKTYFFNDVKVKTERQKDTEDCVEVNVRWRKLKAFEEGDRQTDVEVNERQKDVEVNERQKDVEVNERQKGVEVNERQKDVEVNERQKDVEVNERQKDVEVNERQKDVEVNERWRKLKAFEEGDLMRGGGRNPPLVGVATLSLIIDVDVKASRYCSKNFFFFASKVVQRWRLIMLLLQSRIVSNEKLFKFDVLKKKKNFDRQ
jgi:hypothetical protein